MAGPGWRYNTDTVSAALAPTPSPSSAPGMLTADYDPLVEYEAGLSPVPYPYGGGYPPGCSTPRASSHLVHNASRSAGPGVSRTLSGGFARQMKQGDGMDVESGAPSFGAAAYPVAGALQASYDASLSPFAVSPRAYDTAPSTSAWRSQNCGSHVLSGSSQPKLSSSPHSMASSAGLSRPRRVPRKHTTREEANFQCSVQGCGKFFSRSYNFKSHMETHDEQREYPFPCLVGGCAKKFVRKTDLQRHHQSVHKKERNHRCDYCGRLFARKDTLRRHMEDGCSKRFDIETLDLRSEDHSTVNPADREARPSPTRKASTAKVLPPMAASLANSLGASRYAEMEPKMQLPDRTWER
ncbi:hypothetical protein HRG_000976 [Hirsutella rhossiliensis]|uniref:Epithelial zinc-finger ezf protein-like protein n=1 Tax=Hirsutella rhossiliensis TaxID=111463 RepID=A0A9P8N7T2_9HYPO|nr:epithelial zinc-finger ezf protein-like protein [Hirsutella rhossiliensis]KAH0968334.1 epithelial zinc-finger ezf protein-like protein [Hirsutella rhossiliensis]